MVKKHTQNDDSSEIPLSVYPQELLIPLEKNFQKIKFQEMYPLDILLEIQKLQEKLTESFYVSFYNIVSESMGYFDQVENKCVTVVTRKLADDLIKFAMTKKIPKQRR